MESNGIDYRKIIFFDLDFTITENATNYQIRNLLSDQDNNEIANYYQKYSDIECDQFRLDLLVKKPYTLDIILKEIKNISLVEGFDKLMSYLRDVKEKQNIDIVILSGSNKVFAKCFAENWKFDDIIDSIYSYGLEEVKNGEKLERLLLTPVHFHECKRCEEHFCKGKVIDEYLSSNKYSTACFFGDGLNDLCAGLTLSKYKYINCLFGIRYCYDLYYKVYDKNGKINEIYYSDLKDITLTWENGHSISKILADKLI